MASRPSSVVPQSPSAGKALGDHRLPLGALGFVCQRILMTCRSADRCGLQLAGDPHLQLVRQSARRAQTQWRAVYFSASSKAKQ
jgi:hypothetical protein